MEVNGLVKKGKINALNGLDVEEMLKVKSDYIVKLKEPYEIISVHDYVLKKTCASEEKVIKGLKMVSLSESILDKSMNVLSSSEVIKVELMIQLIRNVDTLFLFQFDYYFVEKELLFFKRLFKKLVKDYGKTIVLLDSRFTFFFDFADRVVVKNVQNDLEVFSPVDCYDERLLSFFEVPKIVEFVNMAKSKGKNLSSYVDRNEVLKAIYRECS